MNFKCIKNGQNVFCIFNRYLYGKSFVPLELEPGQYPYLKRQIPLDGTKSFNERLKEIQKAKADIILDSVNIGYNMPKAVNYIKKEKKLHLEKAARKRQICIDAVDLDNVSQNTPSGINQRFNVARFYHIYDDIFTYPHFFYPIKPLTISFDIFDDSHIPVYHGNLISPTTASSEPTVQFDSDENSLWTLILTSPDEHLEQNDKEYVHWMVSNISIKENQIVSKDIIVPYLQPIPYFGTGFHRYVIVLYKQESGRVDLSKLSLSSDCYLEDRTFSSYDFMKNHQNSLTPIGLSFFQSAWDDSVRRCFREKLNCLEPLFEYQWPKDKLKPQERFPEGKVMHTYLDQYRDVKDIQEEVLKERLKTVDPYKASETLEYPLAVPSKIDEMGFVKDKNKEKALRRNQWRDMNVDNL